MIPVLYVAAGGAIGSTLRYLAVLAIPRGSFPLGTLVVNILGSLLIGMLMARLESDNARLFLVTGILGGFTTFSAFSWDTLQLLQRGQLAQAGLYIGGSVLLSLAAVALGWQVVR